MQIAPFELERYFSKYEFSAPYLLCSSDCEPLTLKELLKMADEETKKLWNDLWLGYTTTEGHPLLRKEISKLYTSIKPDNVTVVVPEEGIFIAMNVLLEPGDHVITTFPGYQSLYEIAKSIGCKIDKWIPRENETWEFKIDDIERLITKKTKLIVVNFPHNPTGASLSKKDFKRLIKLADEHNIYIFSDEMYRYLEYDDNDRLMSASDLTKNAISLFGLSKTFSLAGLRIGWLTTKNETLRKKIAVFKDYTTICNSAPSEILAIMALRAKEKIIRRNKKIILDNLAAITKFFGKYTKTFKWIPPKAGPIAFPKFLGSQSINNFCQNLVNDEGFMLLPSDVYGFNSNNFRIGFGRKSVSAALKHLEKSGLFADSLTKGIGRL